MKNRIPILIFLLVAIAIMVIYLTKNQAVVIGKSSAVNQEQDIQDDILATLEPDIEYDVVPRPRPDELIFNGDIGNLHEVHEPQFDEIY